MNEQLRIQEAWQQVRSNFNSSPQQKLADEFFNRVGSQSEMSWDEMGRLAREKYGEAAFAILSALLYTDNPLIVFNSLRFARLEDPREGEAFKRFIRHADAQKHLASFISLAASPEMNAELKAKGNLPDSVLAALGKKSNEK